MGSPTSDPLDVDLSAGLAPEAQHSLVRALWGNNPAKWLSFHGAKSETDFNAYLKYHSQQCDLIALHNNGKYSTATTHRQIANIAALLRDPNSTRSSVLQQFPSLLRHGTLVQDENTLHLVSRLISMVRIGEVTHEFLAGRSLQWKDGSLSDFLRAHFSSTPVLGHERIKFEKTFNALSLSRIAGLEIQWADNLADHLRLVNDDCVLRVFHHATFLSSQRDQTLFPSNFIAETQQTLALLFPKYDKQLRNWYNIQAEKHGLDPAVMDSGHLIADERQVENFAYWHDRLVVLKQVYDESRPSTLSQWWHDRRNGVQWYTFWVAIVVLFLTVFFGLVQSIEGAIQVYVAFRPV